MPDMKRNFTKGKMNKDLDERLVPPGEYRHAENIQVSTSESSDVGSVENILGNTLGCTYVGDSNPVRLGSRTVGSISDEKNDTLYWLVAGSFEDIEFPVNPGGIRSFKDLIMRTNKETASGCETVFVDKYRTCIGVNAYQPGISNTITLSDPDYYNHITVGMEVTGYIGSSTTSSFNPAIVTSIGDTTSLTVNYANGFTTVPAPGPPVTFTGNVGMRAFNNHGCTWVATAWPFKRSSPCVDDASDEIGIDLDGDGTAESVGLPYIPYAGVSQFYIDPADWDSTITVGSTISATNSTTGGALINGIGGANETVITHILLHDLCSDHTELVPPPPPCMANTCSQYYVLTLQDPVIEANFTINSGPSSVKGETTKFAPFSVVITPFTSAISAYNDIVYLHPSSHSFANEIYEVLFNTLCIGWNCNPMPIAGSFLQIDNSVGGGVNWPPNSCIKKPSVINDAFGFDLGPPATYNTQFRIEDCTTGAAVTPLAGSSGLPLTFFTSTNFGLSAITLNQPVDLANIQTFCFDAERTLNFDPDRTITGVNIIDDLLFWTDNFNEPKKINIPRSIQGTQQNGRKHTALVNAAQELSIANMPMNPVKEEHITVIRPNPKSSLSLELNTGRDPSLNYAGVMNTVVAGGGIAPSIINSSNNTVVEDFSSLMVGDTVSFKIESDASGGNAFNVAWLPGNYLLLKEFELGVSDPTPLANWTIRGVIRDWNLQNFDSLGGDVQVQIEVLAIKGTPPSPDVAAPNTPLSYTVDLENKNDVIFENKFPRFSFRYKYIDGEYSTFAPFTEVAFSPGNFDYDPKKGWNTGMVNHLVSVKLKNFLPHNYLGSSTGQDVVSIDILYKEDTSPNVYTVDTIAPDTTYEFYADGSFKPNPWFVNEYEVTSETIKNVLPSNQLLRLWDNVPKKALAQEVTGNRIVYGNYEQGYDLTLNNKKYKPSFKNYLTNWSESITGVSEKSIKSLRDYKLGVVFTDKYGRETPILVSESGGFKVDKKDSDKYNRLQVGLNSDLPNSDMVYFKFYIKETSSEYYNLAMDRWYAAEDGNIWLAFPSSDRNKVDLDSSLYFKKGDDDTVLENTTRYKILALENEAPEFIKTRKIRIGSVVHDSNQLISATTYAEIFPSYLPDEEAPSVNGTSFSINYEEGRFKISSLSHLEDINKELHIQFKTSSDISDEYKVAQITSNRDTIDAATWPVGGKYFVTLDTNLKDDIAFIFDNPTAPTKINDGVRIQFIQSNIENKPTFDGRFFAKIQNDGKIKPQISDSTSGINYIQKASKMVYVLENDEDLVTRSWLAALSSTTTFATDNFVSLTNSGSNYPFENPGGLNWNHYYVRQAYFGNIQSYNVSPGGRMALLGNKEDHGVWFIDRATRKYSNENHSMGLEALTWTSSPDMDEFLPSCNIIHPSAPFNCGWGGSNAAWDATVNVGNGIYNGTSYSGLSLGFGGFGARVHDALQEVTGPLNMGLGWFHINNPDKTIESFFSIGNGNPDHSDPATTEFVNNLQSGFTFMWEEDPTKTVYTIFNQTAYNQYIRFGRVDDGFNTHEKTLMGAESAYTKRFGFVVEPNMSDWDPAASPGTFMNKGLHLGDGVFYNLELTASVSSGATQISVGIGGTGDAKFGMAVVGHASFHAATTITGIDVSNGIIQLSHPTSGSTISSGTTVQCGFVIRVVSEQLYGVTSGASINENYIIVDNITTECSNGNTLEPTYSLMPGMMLTDYNLDNTPNTPTYGNVIIKSIDPQPGTDNYIINLTGYYYPMHYDPGGALTDFDSAAWSAYSRVKFKQVSMNGASNFTEANTHVNSVQNQIIGSGGIGGVGYKMVFVEAVEEYSDGGNLPPNPFVWETEPKEETPLDIYYEISDNNPTVLNNKTINTAIPIGSVVRSKTGAGFHSSYTSTTVVANQSMTGKEIFLADGLWAGISTPFAGNGTWPLLPGDRLEITRPNGVVFEVKITQTFNDSGASYTSTQFMLDEQLYKSDYVLNWHNCYSFGNGVESNRIKDNFNLPFMANGVKVSTTIDQPYKKEHRKYGLIYSGIYNSTSGVNNLNQFIAAEKITKDINSIYGSIQKLHSGWGQSGDLVALCEDRVLKILANKDALFNADGNTNVTATDRVLGTAIPYSGEFGISTNPESFAAESYRAYFTDKIRGTVMRLSMDGLTPISNFGMKDWFRDNLKLSHKLIGSYDDRKDQYNITLKSIPNEDPVTNVITYDVNTTVSYGEDVKGWISFKSFVPENALSCANLYYTFKGGQLWRHDDENNFRNTFYDLFYPSKVSVIINDLPGTIKTFHTLNYEGSQAKIDNITSSSLSGSIADNYDIWDVTSWNGTINPDGVPNYMISTGTVPDSDHYNLTNSSGWFVRTIETDKEVGTLNEFIEKEGKWFNYIKGKGWQ